MRNPATSIPTSSASGKAPRCRRARPGMALTAILAATLAACGDSQENGAQGGEPQEERAASVTWIEASEQEIREVRETVGSVEARAHPEVAAQVQGLVAAVHAEEGERVEDDAILAEIEADDYRDERAAAAAEVARLEAMVGVQERNVRRARELHADDHISADELDNTRAELKAQEEQLAAARARLQLAERQLERTRLRAPATGVIDQRSISEGDHLSAGEVAFELTGMQRLHLRLPISETLAPRVGPGTQLVVRNRAGSPQKLRTTVDKLRPGIREATRSLHLLATIQNPGTWRPGSSAAAEVVLDIREGVVVPKQSLVRRPGGDVVYVLPKGEDRVEARPVEVGTRLGDRAEIRKGLKAGERIILDGAGFLADGALVDASPHSGRTAEAE